MGLKQINFDNGINCSLQVGDKAYVSEIDVNGIMNNTQYVGPITEINTSGVIVDDLSSIVTDPTIPGVAQQFFSFAKDIVVNECSLKGYYADVTFKNTSTTYAELFAISSEIVPSSK